MRRRRGVRLPSPPDRLGQIAPYYTPAAPADPNLLVWLQKSGMRGAPLTVHRYLEVRPSALPTPEMPGGGVGDDYTRRWPWLFPPSDAFPIVRVNSGVTIAIGTGQDLIVLAETPRGYNGVIKLFGNLTSDFTNTQFTILIKGRPTNPIIAIDFEYGPLNDPNPLPAAGIMLLPGDDLVVRATNIGGAALTGVRARIEGYLFTAGG